MNVKRRVANLVERVTGAHIYGALPRGVDVGHDIHAHLPNLRMEVIFDVGANVGQSARTFIRHFPAARILCFEPVRDTFLQLTRNLEEHGSIRCFNLALGSSVGQVEIRRGKSSQTASVTKLEAAVDPGVEMAELTTLSDFCKSQGIQHISYLKIDTEGSDLEVLRGSEAMLAENAIDVVQVEAGMNPKNTWHVPFERLKAFLEERQYSLFGVYDQMFEWPTSEPQLRRTNSVFISRAVIEGNRR